MTINDIINELPFNDLCDEQLPEIILPTVQQSYQELRGRLRQYIHFNPFAERNDMEKHSSLTKTQTKIITNLIQTTNTDDFKSQHEKHSKLV